MDVNFNNLRKQALYSYDKLVNKLNDSISYEWNSKKIEIDPDDIQEDLDDLRMLLGSIAMVYEPNDENFKDVYSEVYLNKNDEMASFNYNEDDE